MNSINLRAEVAGIIQSEAGRHHCDINQTLEQIFGDRKTAMKNALVLAELKACAITDRPFEANTVNTKTTTLAQLLDFFPESLVAPEGYEYK